MQFLLVLKSIHAWYCSSATAPVFSTFNVERCPFFFFSLFYILIYLIYLIHTAPFSNLLITLTSNFLLSFFTF